MTRFMDGSKKERNLFLDWVERAYESRCKREGRRARVDDDERTELDRLRAWAKHGQSMCSDPFPPEPDLLREPRKKVNDSV